MPCLPVTALSFTLLLPPFVAGYLQPSLRQLHLTRDGWSPPTTPRNAFSEHEEENRSAFPGAAGSASCFPSKEERCFHSCLQPPRGAGSRGCDLTSLAVSDSAVCSELPWDLEDTFFLNRLIPCSFSNQVSSSTPKQLPFSLKRLKILSLISLYTYSHISLILSPNSSYSLFMACSFPFNIKSTISGKTLRCSSVPNLKSPFAFVFG